MSKEIRRIDKREEEKCERLWQALQSGENITSLEIFESKSVANMLEEEPLSIQPSFRETSVALPMNCLLFSKILVTICPMCSCSGNPKLLRPYLEREMVLPILTFPLQHYNADFANLIIKYPYIGAETYLFVKEAHAFTSPLGRKSYMCPHCFGEDCEKILKRLSETIRDKKKAESAIEYLKDVTFPYLTPTLDQESQILQEIQAAVDGKRLDLLYPLTRKASLLETLRMSQAFEAIPHVAHEDLSNIAETTRKIGLSLDTEIAKQIAERELVVKALNIDYDPAMPLEDYLDIIVPRRKKINSLVNELILSKDRDKKLSKLNDEIWEINEEISSSKAIETLTFLTDFVSDNAKILFGMLLGGLIGYSSASFAGCGLGSSLGGLSSAAFQKVVSKYEVFKIPKYPKKTLEWLKEKIEGPEERLLAMMLSKDIRVIQTWAVRKKLKKRS